MSDESRALIPARLGTSYAWGVPDSRGGSMAFQRDKPQSPVPDVEPAPAYPLNQEFIITTPMSVVRSKPQEKTGEFDQFRDSLARIKARKEHPERKRLGQEMLSSSIGILREELKADIMKNLSELRQKTVEFYANHKKGINTAILGSLTVFGFIEVPGLTWSLLALGGFALVVKYRDHWLYHVHRVQADTYRLLAMHTRINEREEVQRYIHFLQQDPRTDSNTFKQAQTRLEQVAYIKPQESRFHAMATSARAKQYANEENIKRRKKRV